MFLGKDVIGNPIINVRNGLQIGKVQDLYIDQDLSIITGLYVGSEGLLSSTPKWIPASDINLISMDTVLVNGDSIITEELDNVKQTWVRRDELQGHPVDTKGGTKIGRVGDIIINNGKNIVGFALDRVFVQGPIAQHRALRRTAILDVGREDGAMTVDLDEAEQNDLQVVNKMFFGQEVVRDSEVEEIRKSPYTDTPDESAYVDHSDTSPYVANEVERVEDGSSRRTPYTAPDNEDETTDSEEFKSPYTTPIEYEPG